MFIPVHCPHPGCSNYHHPQTANWYRYFGIYRTKTFGSIPRFRCNSCRKTFSSQTFSINYYAKKTLKMRDLYAQVNGGVGIRKIARNLNVHHNTIRNRIARMTRNAILIHQQILSNLPFREDFVADGFESFCFSQYFPDNYHLLVGESSQFVYRTDYITLRRKGRMREDQKKKRADLEKQWRAPKGNLERSFGELCEWLAGMTSKRRSLLTLYTDEKTEYRRALMKSPICGPEISDRRWFHHTTSSHKARNRANRLFAVNYMDREIRKDMAAHARQTVQFNRNVNDAMLRMSLYVFDHNYLKPYRIRNGEKNRLRHAEVAGADRVELEMMLVGFFTNRYFSADKNSSEGPDKKSLERRWETPLGKNSKTVRKHLAT